MHSRARKIARTDSDFQTLHRQLNSDFQVHLYLTDQQNQHSNTSGYATLLNSLMLHRRERSKTLQRLKTTYQYTQANQQVCQYSQFKDLEERTGKEQEIKKTLEREIGQIKKSFNLLKGDIGHLVIRNQSAKLLGSKVNKAKIVAEDQLKRVTLALAKDREEIKLRNEMQKKFSKKLKNISNYQSNGLSRVKNDYIESQLRKEEVHKKLLLSQKTAQNGQEMAQLLTFKEKLDENNLQLQQGVLELRALVDNFSIKQKDLPQNITTLHSEISSFLENLQQGLLEPSTTQIQEAADKIIDQYKNLKESIRVWSQFYEEHLIFRDQLVSKVQQLEQEQQNIRYKFQYELLQNYTISDQDINDFHAKLHLFTTIIKTYFVLLSKLEQTGRRTGIQTAQNQYYNRLSCHQNPNTTSSYINQLHHIHHVLTSSEALPQTNSIHNLSSQQIHNFYQFMLSDIHQWLRELKNNIKEEKQSNILRRPYVKPTNYNRVTQILEPIPSQVLQEPIQVDLQPKDSSPSKSQDCKKPQRIKLLQDIDSNYYKMIKSTLKMEKENTRKNYNFLKNFKRAKYASRDQLLEEKRFEASFSVLFANRIEATHTHSRTVNTRETFQKNSQIPNPFRPFKTTHSSTHTSFRKKDSRQNTAVPDLRKVRSSFFGEKEKKSRMTQKLKMALEYC